MKTSNSNVRFEKYDIYCGRAKNGGVPKKIGKHGWLGNPIKINEECIICKKIHKESGETLPCYEKYLKFRLNDDTFKKEFIKLKGKCLGCFCKPKPCHTDIMIKYLEKL
jgi:hypothetical protein